ncbi:MAG: hypothetical protein K6G18_16735 [Treponema sp.]|nr:hypothetical protein [Treponema sp.]
MRDCTKKLLESLAINRMFSSITESIISKELIESKEKEERIFKEKKLDA